MTLSQWTLAVAVVVAAGCSPSSEVDDGAVTSTVVSTSATTAAGSGSTPTPPATAPSTTTTATTIPKEPRPLITPVEPGRVAYVEYSGDQAPYSEVFTMNPDGSDQRRLTFDGGILLGQLDAGLEDPIDVYSSNGQPRWTPDGTELGLLALVDLDQREVRVVGPDGSNTSVLFTHWEGSMVSWSPNGGRIAYTTDDGVWIARSDGTGADLLVPYDPTVIGPCGPTTATFSTTWSADGNWVAFIESDSSGYCAGVEFITIAGVDTGEIVRGVCVEGRNQSIDWHPIETQLLVSECDGSAAIVGTDGSVVESLPFSGYSPAWSPSGKQILYNAGQPWGQDGALWSHDVQSETTTLLLDSFGGGSMDWQPVGNG